MYSDLPDCQVLSIPPLVWGEGAEQGINDDEEDNIYHIPPPDQLIVNRLGFLFIAYRVEYWWWEGLVTFSKVSAIVILHRKCTRALTFSEFLQEMFRKFLMTAVLGEILKSHCLIHILCKITMALTFGNSLHISWVAFTAGGRSYDYIYLFDCQPATSAVLYGRSE